MANKKKKRGGGRNIQGTVFKWLRVAALVAPGVYAGTTGYKAAGVEGAARDVVRIYSGYDIVTGKFSGDEFAKGWLPLLMTTLATVGVPKITSIIRKL